MSAVVKLASAMPSDTELNGIDSISQDLIDNPDRPRIAVVVFTTRTITSNPELGTTVPTIAIRRIEPLGYQDQVSEVVRQELVKAAESRTGKAALPLDTVEVVDQGSLGDGDDI